jgi:hypothetical protein
VGETKEHLPRVRLHHLARELGLGRSGAEPDAHPRPLRSGIEVDHRALDEEGMPGGGSGLHGDLRMAGDAFLDAFQERLVDAGDRLLHVLGFLAFSGRRLARVERRDGDSGVVRELEGLDDLELVEILLAPRRVLAGSGAGLAGRAGGDGKPGHQQPGEALGQAHVSSL